MTVRIDGKSLTIEDVINVCRHYEKVEITEDAKITVNRSRDYVREKLEKRCGHLRIDNRIRKICQRQKSHSKIPRSCRRTSS
jgi:Histidine ammonia-lyase